MYMKVFVWMLTLYLSMFVVESWPASMFFNLQSTREGDVFPARSLHVKTTSKYVYEGFFWILTCYLSMFVVESWPASIFFNLQSTREGGIVFPARRYPKALPVHSPLKIAKMSLRAFEDDRYKLFHIKTTPTQYGRNHVQRIHSHLVLATEDRWAWLLEHGAIELSKTDNPILALNRGDGGSATGNERTLR